MSNATRVQPIGPDQALALSPQERATLDRELERINQALIGIRHSEGYLSVNLRPIGLRVLDEIIRQYELAGWGSVEVDRENNSLRFFTRRFLEGAKQQNNSRLRPVA